MYFNTSDRNCYMSYLEVVYETVSTDDSKIEQDLMFSDGTAYYWPFDGNNECSTWESHKGTNVTIGPFNTTAYPDIKYNFILAQVSVENHWRTTKGRGLAFGVKGDYMQICPVEGYKLTSIKLKSGNGDGIAYSIQDAEGSVVTGGELQSIAANGAEHTFTLTGTTANTEYRLVVNYRSSIAQMWITYERVD